MSGDARKRLIAILQLAYSGERAAGYAYEGHRKWEHEAYFRARVESHAWAGRLPMWPRPLAKATIRARR